MMADKFTRLLELLGTSVVSQQSYETIYVAGDQSCWSVKLRDNSRDLQLESCGLCHHYVGKSGHYAGNFHVI